MKVIQLILMNNLHQLNNDMNKIHSTTGWMENDMKIF